MVLHNHAPIGDNIGAVSREKRKPWASVVRFGLSAAALVLLFQIVRFDDVVTALRSAAPMGLALAALLNVATRCAAGGRTYAVSRAGNLRISFSSTLQALFISNFWGLALPGIAAGSVATVHRYHGHGAGILQSLVVLTASRVLELLAFCSLALIGLATTTRAANGSRLWVAIVLMGLIALVVFGLFLRRRVLEPAVLPIAENAASPGSVRERGRAAAFAAIRLLCGLPRRALLQAFGWALLQGVLDAATVLVLALALGIPIGLPQALWINALSYLAILLPISAAGLGVREVAVLAALLPLGVSRVDALGLALLMLAMTLLNALVGALLQLFTPAASRQTA